MSACTPRIGIWAAILSVLFAACFSIVALAANFTTLVPAIWVNPLSFAPSVLLAWSYLVLMACVLDAALPEHRVWAVLGLCFAVLYATMNSILYFVQLVVVTPLVFQGDAELAGMLAFGPRSFMLSLNGLAYGLMSASAFLAAFRGSWPRAKVRARRHVGSRRHGAHRHRGDLLAKDGLCGRTLDRDVSGHGARAGRGLPAVWGDKNGRRPASVGLGALMTWRDQHV